MRSAVRDAKAYQRIVSDTEIMTRVLEISADRWQRALVFSTGKKLVTPEEVMALRIAGQIPHKLPTPIQSKKLLVVMERLKDEGFRL